MYLQLPNQLPAAYHSQSANATGKSKLIKTGDAYDPVHSHLWVYRRTGESIRVRVQELKKKKKKQRVGEWNIPPLSRPKFRASAKVA